MKTLEAMLTEWMQDVFRTLYPEVDDVSRMGVVATTDPSFGDYQCNAAMALAKVLQESNFKGLLQTDGATGFDKLGIDKQVIRLGCLAHCRRYSARDVL